MLKPQPFKSACSWHGEALPVRLFVVGLLLGLMVWECQAEGQTNAVSGDAKATLASASKSKGKNKPVVSERPQVIGATTETDSGDTAKKPARPGTSLSGDAAQTAELVEKFQAARNDYLQAQKELNLRTKNATEAQRAQLREKAGEALAKWREQQRSYLEDQQERIKTIKNELQSDLGQRVDNVGEGTGGGRGR